MFVPLARNFTTVILIALVSAVLFCTWSVSAMSMDEPMNDCATQQSQLALCNASPQRHLTWQNFLPVTPQKVLDFLLASLLLAVGFFVSRSWLHAPPLVGQYFRTKIQGGLSIIDPIRRALARGIIQPQIYELAIA
jgi:hypothetical protein